MPSRPDPLAIGALVFGAAAIGFAPILARLTDAGPAATAFWRLAFAAPLLAAAAFRPGTRGDRAPGRWAIAAGLLFALDMTFWHYSLAYTSVTNATVLTNLTPVVVTFAAWLVFKERPRRLFVVALALAVAGAFGMAAATAAGGQGARPALGDALATVSALWYGGYFLCVRRARGQMGAARLMFWSAAAGMPLLIVISLAMQERVLPASAAGWAACVGLGVMHVAGQGSIAWALARVPTALASVTVLVQPVVAAVLGWFVFTEAVVPLQALGAAVLLAGVILAQWSAQTASDDQRQTR